MAGFLLSSSAVLVIHLILIQVVDSLTYELHLPLLPVLATPFKSLPGWKPCTCPVQLTAFFIPPTRFNRFSLRPGLRLMLCARSLPTESSAKTRWVRTLTSPHVPASPWIAQKRHQPSRLRFPRSSPSLYFSSPSSLRSCSL